VSPPNEQKHKHKERLEINPSICNKKVIYKSSNDDFEDNRGVGGIETSLVIFLQLLCMRLPIQSPGQESRMVLVILLSVKKVVLVPL